MFDLFRKGGQPSVRQIQRTTKKLTEPHGEQTPRLEAAEKLRSWGTDEALFSLLKRFTISSRVITQDVEEKQLVVKMLVRSGSGAVEPIIRFIKTHQQVDWPVRALAQMVSKEELVNHLVDAIEVVALSEFAASEHRVSLIRAVQEYVTPDMSTLLRKFLIDSDDDVRITAIEALGAIGESEREALLIAFLEAIDRPRIQLRILDLFAERSWSVKGFRPKVEEALHEDFILTSKGLIRRR